MSSESVRAFLISLKARNRLQNVPSISEETAELLSWLVRAHSSRAILELGTAHGYSTIVLAGAASQTSASSPVSVSTVDFSRPSYEAAVAHVREAGFEDRVTHVFADAIDYVAALSAEGRRFDAVFLDAEKRSTAKLFDLAWPLVSPGGWMAVDDVVKFRYKMEDFYQMLAERKIPYEIVMTDPDDGVMVFYKR